MMPDQHDDPVPVDYVRFSRSKSAHECLDIKQPHKGQYTLRLIQAVQAIPMLDDTERHYFLRKKGTFHHFTFIPSRHLKDETFSHQ